MPHRPTAQQLDLFDPSCDAGPVPTPPWQSLPDETRLRLTELVVRWLLDHADGAACRRKEAGHEA